MSLFEKFRKRSQSETKEGEVAYPRAAAPPEGETSPLDSPSQNVHTSVEMPSSGSEGGGSYRRVRIDPGPRGWGKGLIIEPKPGKDLIYSVTGGGIHPVAQRIAELSGGKPFDGFKSKADFDQIAVAVIDCGGTARVGVYPMKGVPTVDIHPASPSGPLMRFITEENFVSGVTPEQVRLVEE